MDSLIFSHPDPDSSMSSIRVHIRVLQITKSKSTAPKSTRATRSDDEYKLNLLVTQIERKKIIIHNYRLIS